MNNREIATFILLGVFVILMIWIPGSRRILPSLAQQLFASRITLLLVLFVAVILTAIRLADHLDLWSHNLLAATILWFLLVGFVWFVNLGDAGKDPNFFKRRLLETLGFTRFSSSSSARTSCHYRSTYRRST